MKNIIQFGEGEKAKITLKIIKSYNCYRLVGILESGEQISICEVEENGEYVSRCVSDLKDYLSDENGKSKSRSPKK